MRLAKTEQACGARWSRARHGAERLRRPHAELKHPRIHHRCSPIAIVPMRDSIVAPIGAPGVEDPEPQRVVTDNGEGMAAGAPASGLDVPCLWLVPVRVDLSRRID